MARDIPLGNGHLLVAYTPQGLIRDVYYPRVGQENHAGGGAFRVGVWEYGKFEWLPDCWQCEVGYLEDTLVTQVVWTHFERGLRLVLNDTVDFHENVHLRKLTVSETAGRKRMLRLFFGFDFSIGGNDIGDTVALRPETGCLVHYKHDNHPQSRRIGVSCAIREHGSQNAKGAAMGEATVLYGGLDLHGDNVFCTLMDAARNVRFEQRFPNDLFTITEGLKPFRKLISKLAVESTYNWYWLVDGLRKLKYDVRLANPAKMQENIGLKAANDKTDARFIARQLVNGILPEGYIYPEETRGVRDMLRRRMRLVHERTSEWLSLMSLVARHTGQDMTITELEGCELKEVFKGQPHALVMAQASERHIGFLNDEVKALEKEVLRELPDKETYKRLMTVPGIGMVLARTILLETGPVSRFKEAGNYASYCRAVSTVHTSNGKKKGEGNGKCGNRYLAWAYVEAANCAARHSPEMHAWFQRKQARSGKRVIAVKALANKLAKACYFMMRDGTEFDVKKLTGI